MHRKKMKLVIAIENNCFLFIYILMYSCGGKAEFSAAITPVFTNHCNMLIWLN